MTDPIAETLAQIAADKQAREDALAAEQAIADRAAAESAASTERLAAEREAARLAELHELEEIAASNAGERS